MIWRFSGMGLAQNGWLTMENTVKMDDLGGENTISGNLHVAYIHQVIDLNLNCITNLDKLPILDRREPGLHSPPTTY